MCADDVLVSGVQYLGWGVAWTSAAAARSDCAQALKLANGLFMMLQHEDDEDEYEYGYYEEDWYYGEGEKYGE